MKKANILYVFFFICFLHFTAFSQDKKIIWFPEKSNFPMLENDLLECKVYTGIHFLKTENVSYKGVYIPLNIGLTKTLLNFNSFGWRVDFSAGVASYTQFEIIQYDANTLRGGLLNNDYKAAGIIGLSKESNKIRLQLFHISSHLGDDYMIRNEYFERNDKSVNYEQFDLLYLRQINATDIYGGIGTVITPNTFRKRFMIQAGVQTDFELQSNLFFTFGSDIKIYQENDYLPDIHSSMGISILKREKKQVSFLIDNYFGHIPYSTLKFGKVFWLGISTIIYL